MMLSGSVKGQTSSGPEQCGPWEQIKYANHENYMSHEIIMHVYNKLRGWPMLIIFIVNV